MAPHARPREQAGPVGLGRRLRPREAPDRWPRGDRPRPTDVLFPSGST